MTCNICGYEHEANTSGCGGTPTWRAYPNATASPSSLPTTKETKDLTPFPGEAGVAEAMRAYCQHPNPQIAEWKSSPGHGSGTYNHQVTAYWCPACRRVVRL